MTPEQEDFLNKILANPEQYQKYFLSLKPYRARELEALIPDRPALGIGDPSQPIPMFSDPEIAGRGTYTTYILNTVSPISNVGTSFRQSFTNFVTGRYPTRGRFVGMSPSSHERFVATLHAFVHRRPIGSWLKTQIEKDREQGQDMVAGELAINAFSYLVVIGREPEGLNPTLLETDRRNPHFDFRDLIDPIHNMYRRNISWPPLTCPKCHTKERAESGFRPRGAPPTSEDPELIKRMGPMAQCLICAGFYKYAPAAILHWREERFRGSFDTKAPMPLEAAIKRANEGNAEFGKDSFRVERLSDRAFLLQTSGGHPLMGWWQVFTKDELNPGEVAAFLLDASDILDPDD